MAADHKPAAPAQATAPAEAKKPSAAPVPASSLLAAGFIGAAVALALHDQPPPARDPAEIRITTEDNPDNDPDNAGHEHDEDGFGM
jgi:hypothetical protein